MISPSIFSGPAHNDQVEATVFHATLAPTLFYPVGASIEDSEELDDIEVFYFPTSDDIDAKWLRNRFPASGDELFSLLSIAFNQYCGDGWCGADMREEVLAALGDYDDEPASNKFKKEGYPPFFGIQQIYLYPKIDTIVISGHTDIDYNLDEHGVDIKISPSGVEFGYGADFMVLHTSSD